MKDEGSNTEPSASENPVKRWLVRNKVYIGWGFLAILAGYVGLAGILAFAGLKLLPITFSTVEVLDNQAKGAIVTAAVSWVAGIAALFTFFLNRDQKEMHLQKQLEQNAKQAERQRQQDEEHHQAQLDQARTFEDERAKKEAKQAELQRQQDKEHHQAQLDQARTFEDERAKKEAKQAELQRLEKLFGDLAEDFASDVVLNRINAAIGLSEIAQTPDPRCISLEKTKVNYPYFLRAADRLAAALHQWGEQPARDEVRKAIRQLAHFAKAEGTEEPLLHDLCNSLADANRTALGIFVETMAEGLSAERPNLAELADLCEFLGDPKENESCLKQLSESLDGKRALRRWESLRRANNAAATAGLATDYYQRFARASQALLDARDALAGALTQRSRPLGLPEPLTDWSPNDQFETFRDLCINFGLERPLDLNSTFLTGANLCQAQLQGASLSKAFLQGANMIRVELQAADLRMAQLKSAMLIQANLQHANFAMARLPGAYLVGVSSQFADFDSADLEFVSLQGARLQRARFSSAQLHGARLLSAQLEGASLSRAQLHGAHLRGAVLVGARLAGAQCGQDGGEPAVFSPGGWVDADFRAVIAVDHGLLPEYGEEDTELKDWLMATYPPDTPPSPE